MNAEGIITATAAVIVCGIGLGIYPLGCYLLWRDRHRARQAIETRRRAAEHASIIARKEEHQREKRRAEEERQRGERRKAHTARAVAAFPGYWTEDRILNRPVGDRPK